MIIISMFECNKLRHTFIYREISCEIEISQSTNSLITSVAARLRCRPSPNYSVHLARFGWLGSRVVSVLDSGAEEPWFRSQSRRCRVTVLGKLFTPVVPLFTKQQNW